MKKVFLEAEWRKLLMVNYTIEPSILTPYLPKGTELDLWNGACYVSVVGFMFLNTKLKGIKIPLHSDFEEVNLRFYVRYNDNGNWKRGVVFIKEIVPKPALTFVANSLYGEHYVTMDMEHYWSIEENYQTIAYKWKSELWNFIAVKSETISQEIEIGSEEEFITEHYWGYTKRNNDTTSEYGVEHSRWKVYKTKSYDIQVDFQMNYGNDFSFLKDKTPKSVFLAEGSDVLIREGSRLHV